MAQKMTRVEQSPDVEDIASDFVIENKSVTQPSADQQSDSYPKAAVFQNLDEKFENGLIIGNACVVESTNVEEPEPENKSGIKYSVLRSMREIKGLLMIFCAGVIFTVLSTVSKSFSDLSAGQYVFYEGLFTVCVLLPFCLYTGTPISPLSVTHRRKWFWIRLTTGSVMYYGKILAVKHMDIGDATALYFTAPLWAGLFARIFLKERYTVINIIATVIGFIGIILIAKPGFIFPKDGETSTVLWSGITSLVAVMAGFSYCATRGVGPAASPKLVTLGIAMFNIPVGLVGVPVVGDVFVLPASYTARVVLVLCGVAAAAGYTLLNGGLAIEKTGPASLMRNFDTVLAYIVQLVIFSVAVDWVKLVGAGLIISSTIFVTLDKMYDFSGQCCSL